MIATRDLSREFLRREQTTWCPHVPHPKQQQFLALTDREALYGGAAGGGKSDALLMEVLRDVETPGYAALALRRTFADLKLSGAIMQRANTWLRGTAAKWNGNDKRWTFPSGATLQFGYLDHEDDKYRYQSAEFHCIVFDELTQFTETQYTYLLSRLRRLQGSEVRTRARAGSNPGGEGHDWVMSRFVKGSKPFVPARLEDNPSIDATDYRQSLALLDSVTRRQLELGEWVQDATGLVYRPTSLNWRSVAPELDHFVLALDFGVVDENAICILGWAKHDQTVWVLECYRMKGEPSAVGEEMQRLCSVYAFDQIVGDVGGLGKGYQAEIESRFGIPIDPAEKQNRLGYVRLINGALERGQLVCVEQRCQDLKEEWASLMRAKGGAEAPNQVNHAADATLYGWRACQAFAEREKPRERTRAEIVREETETLMRTMRGEPEEVDEWAQD